MPKIVRIGLIVVAVIAGFLIATSIIAPRLFKIDSYRGDVVSMLDQQTGRQIAIGHLGLRIFPSIAFRADQVAIANPPGFPVGDWFTAQRIYARLDLDALLHGQVVIARLHIENPSLSLLQNHQGVWNYQVTSPAAPPGAHPDSHDPPLFTLREISKVVVSGGTLRAAALSSRGQAVECLGISSTVQNIILAPPATPQNGPAPAPQALVIPSASGSLEISSISAAQLKVTKLSSPLQTSPAGVLLQKLKFDFYGGGGSGTAQVNVAGPAPQYQAQIQLRGVDVAKLLDAFPQWRGRMTGKMDSDIAVRGTVQQASDPLMTTEGHGTVSIRNGRLPTLQLNSSLTDLMRIAHIGPAKGDLSNFSSIVASWQLAKGVLSNPSIRIVGSGITVDGSGYAQMAGTGALHYHGAAEIEAHRSVLTSVLTDLSGASFKDGKIGFPFNLEGTFEKPVFRLNPAQAASTTTTSPRQSQPADVLRDIFGLFRSKKPAGH